MKKNFFFQNEKFEVETVTENHNMCLQHKYKEVGYFCHYGVSFWRLNHVINGNELTDFRPNCINDKLAQKNAYPLFSHL